MEKISATDQLKKRILVLEIRKDMEYELLKIQVKTTYEGLKPVNLVKNAVSNLVKSPDLKGDIINTLMGLAAGYLTKKVAVGETNNPVKNMMGTLLQLAVTGIVSKNGGDIRSGATNLISNFLTTNNKKR